MNLLPDPLPGQFSLAVLPHGSTRQVLQVVARLALRGSLRVLDGGNRFNAYTVALALRQHTIEVEAILEQIHVARAFTCYQVVTLLTQTPAIPQPTLVLDMLATFRDESVSLEERRRLLRSCLDQLHRLAGGAPLLVSAIPQGTQSDELLIMLEEVADQIWRFGPPEPLPSLRLF
jgi:phage tail sheath gpL-like